MYAGALHNKVHLLSALILVFPDFLIPSSNLISYKPC